jgi:hypothetical protein
LRCASANLASFLDASRLYNGVNISLAALGLAVGVIGFLITILQLRKTKAAAEAARTAAREASEHLARIEALVDISKLRVCAVDLLRLIQQGQYDAAHLRAWDLRQSINEARESTSGKSIVTAEKWQGLLTAVVSVHESVQKRKGKDRQAIADGRLQETVNDIIDQLTRFASAAACVIASHPAKRST